MSKRNTQTNETNTSATNVDLENVTNTNVEDTSKSDVETNESDAKTNESNVVACTPEDLVKSDTENAKADTDSEAADEQEEKGETIADENVNYGNTVSFGEVEIVKNKYGFPSAEWDSLLQVQKRVFNNIIELRDRKNEILGQNISVVDSDFQNILWGIAYRTAKELF